MERASGCEPQGLPPLQLRSNRPGMMPDSEGTETTPKRGHLKSSSAQVLPVPGCHPLSPHGTFQVKLRGEAGGRKAHGPSSTFLTLGPHSYSHTGLCHQKRPCLVDSPAAAVLRVLIGFFLKGTTFSFTLGPTNYVAGSAHRKLRAGKSHTLPCYTNEETKASDRKHLSQGWRRAAGSL